MPCRTRTSKAQIVCFRFTAAIRNSCNQTASVSCAAGARSEGIWFVLDAVTIPGGNSWEAWDEENFDGTILRAGCSDNTNAVRDDDSCQACLSGVRC